jgi:ribosomal protein L29
MENLEKITEQNIAALKTQLTELKEELQKLKIQQLSKELQLPVEVIENSKEIEPVRRTKRGSAAIPLLESEIRDAQEKTITAADAARYLRVNYYTYRKYARLYGIFKTNVHYKKEGRIMNPEKGKYPISRLLAGEFPNYPVYRLKDKLIQSGIKKPECEQCGFHERRITDGKMPLILNFEDENPKNHKLENIRLLCYNCSFICGKGYIRRGTKYHVLHDPDRVQGADVYIPKRF